MSDIRHRQFPTNSTLCLALGAVVSLGLACGDNIEGNPTADAAMVDAAIDAPMIDAPVCATPDPATIGGACSDTDACDAPNDAGGTPFCLNDDPMLPESWPVEGFCTTFCASDAQCDEGSTCAMLPDGMGGSFGSCMPNCCDEVGVGDACETGRLCADSLFGDPIMTEACVPGTPDAPDGAACSTFADCDKNSVCRADQFQFPGGQCATIQCRPDEDNCAAGGDGRCVDLPDEVAPVCVDDCDTDADCRTEEGYRCIDRGGTAGKFCQHPGPGDNCADDSECGLSTETWACRDGARYPGGYCTIENCDINNNDTCPIFSFCVQITGEPDTFCADECSTPGGNECGDADDYQCETVNIAGGGSRNVCVPAMPVPPIN